MAARSPRGSLSGSSDIAADFEESLKDLTRNDKHEIMNLTTIAKESSEHALAISKVLQKHIREAPPDRKLPALYVLDSIVKNVAEPYSEYLQRDLYGTFFRAYTLVQPAVRKAMESLLRTWKEPVPGSISPRPVFPLEAVRPIENALIKFRTAALQGQRQPPLQGQPAYLNTPTPPQYNGQFAPPPMVYQQPMHQQYSSQQPTPVQQYAQPAFPPPTPVHQQIRSSTPVQPPPVDFHALKSDIASLVPQLQSKFAATPHDQAIRTKLNALLQLQKLVNAGDIPPAALQNVRDQVTAVANTISAQSTPVLQQAYTAVQWQPQAQIPQWQTPVPSALPYQQPPSNPPHGQPNPAAMPPSTLLAPGALNNLQSLLANGQKPSTPQMRSAAPALQNASHAQLSNVSNNVAAAPAANPSDLLAALAKSGILPNVAPPSAPAPAPPPPATAPPPSASAADLLKSLQGILPPPNGTPTMPPAALAIGKPKIPMTSASLKSFRPELIRDLYDNQPNQCSNCGRRFLATEDGRAKKARHLDWHFRTNQRMADPQISRGQHRNWFVDEMEWIRLTDFDPSTTTAADAAASAAIVKKQKGPEDMSVRAPPGMTTNTCSICQEEMRSSYSEEAQDWVFANATVYNGKICHATCVAEIRGGPESMLGKRKAESVLMGAGTRMRVG